MEFGIAVWQIYQLQGNSYAEVEKSPTFPIVEKTDLYVFLEQAKQDEIEAEYQFRNWVKQQLQR